MTFYELLDQNLDPAPGLRAARIAEVADIHIVVESVSINVCFNLEFSPFSLLYLLSSLFLSI